MCKQYHEENPDVVVKPVYAGSYADTRTKVQAAIKAGNTPDMAIMFSIDLYSLLAMDAIQDMNSMCATDADKERLNGFYDGFMMNSRSSDTTYGIPWQRSTIVLYYKFGKYYGNTPGYDGLCRKATAFPRTCHVRHVV